MSKNQQKFELEEVKFRVATDGSLTVWVASKEGERRMNTVFSVNIKDRKYIEVEGEKNSDLRNHINHYVESRSSLSKQQFLNAYFVEGQEGKIVLKFKNNDNNEITHEDVSLKMIE